MTAEPEGRIVLAPRQDRRVRGGHPWIFSNEIAKFEGDPPDGALVEVTDSRGAYLGRAYLNRKSLITARILTRGRDAADVDFFARRIERALKFREARLPGEEAVRVVYGEADQLPGLVVDRYRDVLAVQILTLGMEVRAQTIREALERVLAPAGAAKVADSPLRALEGLPMVRETWWGEVPDRLEVRVEGFRVEADVLHGQKTGLFLDQRLNRRHAETHARGRRVLDVFCYKGEWTMHAKRGGAERVLALDVSESALAATGRNLERNGLAEGVELRKADAFDALRRMEREGEKFGLIVLDPPALVKSGRQLAAAARGYRELNRAAMAMLDDDGVLITCSCSHHLDDVLFRQVLREASRAAHRPFRVLDWTAEGPDHPQLLAVPETHYLKCAVLQVP